jgi:hypothetical protein
MTDLYHHILRTHQWIYARPTLPGDPDYAPRWKIVNTVNKGRYTQYQKKTERAIAIVELRPAVPLHVPVLAGPCCRVGDRAVNSAHGRY